MSLSSSFLSAWGLQPGVEFRDRVQNMQVAVLSCSCCGIFGVLCYISECCALPDTIINNIGRSRSFSIDKEQAQGTSITNFQAHFQSETHVSATVI